MAASADLYAETAALEGVPSALAATRDGIDALLRDRGLRRTSPELTVESLFRGAVASASLEGSASSAQEMREGAGDEIAAGVVRMSTQLLSLVPVFKTSPLQAIARIHAVAASGYTEAEMLGRPRPAEGLAHSLHGLAKRLLQPTSAPAIAVAALVHAELVTLAPFASANGIVARAVERLILVVRGVDPASVTVPEMGHHGLEASYRAALTAYAEGGLEGRRSWLLHAAAALAAGAEESPLNS